MAKDTRSLVTKQKDDIIQAMFDEAKTLEINGNSMLDQASIIFKQIDKIKLICKKPANGKGNDA